ncbi:glycosyltransferase family 4 protein [Planococcus beijingensis]|uniref:glycosyltransferase family 4 protein n=1 Tax=Planococcus beijingensis TaxID=2782551 RepID=UPI00193B220E|nr:glycosyltransferase family 4 protein [Planococcus beijingensis]
MKVLMAAPYDAKGRFKGGIMYVANSIYLELEKQKNKEIEIVKFETCRIERSNSSTSKINTENIKNFQRLRKDLITEINNSKAEVLYYHSSIRLALFKDILALRRAKVKTNIKTILHIHFAEYEKIMFSNETLNKIIIDMLNKYVDKVVFLSKTTAKEFVEKGLVKKKVKVIYNFHNLNYSTEQINQKVIETKEKEKLDLIFMGSIDERKGIFDILKSIEKINGSINLHVCGSFNDKNAEKQFNIFKEKYTDKVKFYGYINETKKKELLYKSDVLILPSYSEGLPIVIMEAFGAACSIITTNVGAIPEIFDEKCGYIVEPGNIKKIQSTIKELVDNRKKCSEQMLNNYKYGKKYTIDIFSENLINVCIEVKSC